MSFSNKALLSSLLALALAIPAGAQAPAAQTPADTAVKDSVAPKKSRFGGLMNKAKSVAGNKALQGAAKGVAANVACNAVPGAAVAAAATGNTACQNTLMGQVVQKGMGGTAAAMAGGAASGIASKAVGNLSGTKGAAAAGALQAVTGANVTGAGGLKGAAAAMAGSKVNGLGQAAAAAAAGKMMGKGAGATGLTNAASIAAAQAAAARMAPNGGALPNGVGAPSAADMAAAMNAMNAMNNAATGGKKVETVDFRELKALLPGSAGGIARTDASGEKSGAMGIMVSSAEGTYESADGKQVTLKISDIGSLSGVAGMTGYAWANNEIDRESDNEYEKSTTFKGYKALEKYNKKTHSGDLSVLIGGRFVVEAQGSNVDMKALKDVLASVDLKKLDGMKGKGVK
ncbi:MAG: hypothetical protein ABI556_04495 [Gemmatimonadales bacterium]